jgi:hypothetical protein
MVASARGKNCLTRLVESRGHAVLIASALLILSGCQALSIPSYRSDVCQHKVAGNPYGQTSGESCDSADCDSQECQADGTPDAGYGQPCDYAPVFPLPACLARYREREKLPEGPDRIRFHPLPTRPMFQPRPSTNLQAQYDGASGDLNAPYGSIPEGHGWRSNTRGHAPLPYMTPESGSEPAPEDNRSDAQQLGVSQPSEAGQSKVSILEQLPRPAPESP